MSDPLKSGLSGSIVTIAEAKTIINRPTQLVWSDRNGNEKTEEVYTFAVGFVPLYGPCLITDKGEIRLDRVSHWELAVQIAA